MAGNGERGEMHSEQKCGFHAELSSPTTPFMHLLRKIILMLLHFKIWVTAKLIFLSTWMFIRLFGLALYLSYRLSTIPALRILQFLGIKNRTEQQVVDAEKKVGSVVHVSFISHKQYMLTQVLRKKGIKATYVAINTSDNDRLAIGYDYNIPMDLSRFRSFIMRMLIVWNVLARHDVIHYHFNSFVIGSTGWELEGLRKIGKVIVFHFRGCDVRSRSRNMAVYPDLNVCQECDYPLGSCDTDFQRMKLEVVRKYGDLFFATTPDLVPLFDGAEHIPFIMPYGIDFDSIEPAAKREGWFRVVTSSNHPGLDGVSYVRSAVERLQGEGLRIELVDVVQRPYREALSIYRSADLYAGKLRMGYYNNANIETMLMGVPNISYISPKFEHLVPDSPIINGRPDNVYEKIKYCLENPDDLRDRAQRGIDFVKKHHDPDKIVDYMLASYNRIHRQKNNLN